MTVVEKVRAKATKPVSFTGKGYTERIKDDNLNLLLSKRASLP